MSAEAGRRKGWIRHRDLLAAGIDPHVLRNLLSEGELERVRRGLYRLAEPWGEHTGLAAVAAAAPGAVVCLLSALDYYDLTRVTPSQVHLAIPRKARPPRFEYPPVRVVRYGDRLFGHGITTRTLAGGQIMRIYTREKTIADVFHFADFVGRDVALEALRAYLRQSGRDIDRLLEAASVCRVRPQLTHYLEALL